VKCLSHFCRATPTTYTDIVLTGRRSIASEIRVWIAKKFKSKTYKTIVGAAAGVGLRRFYD